MKRLVVVMMVALIAAGSVCAQRAKRYNTANMQQAEVLMNEGKLDESLRCYEAELKEHPKNPYAHFMMTTIYMEQGKYDYAMQAVDKALKYMPKKQKRLRGISHAIKASIHSNFSEWDEAVKQLSLCLSALPDDADSYQDRAVAYRQRAEVYKVLGQNEQAEQDIKKAEELMSLVKSSN